MALRIPKLRVNRTWLMLGGAIALGLAATWLTTKYLQAREASIKTELEAKSQTGPEVSVVVPSKDLPRGAVVDMSMVLARPIPGDLMSADTIVPDMWPRFDGSRLLRAVKKGVPLHTTDIDEKGKNISDLIEPGARALTIDTDDTNSISQLIRPGNFVDLFIIMPDQNDPSGSGQQIVLLLQHLKVFATGVRVSPSEEAPAQPGQPQGVPTKYTTVTLEVSPEQAARIALGQQLGKFRVVMRNAPDDKMVSVGKITTQNLLKKAATSDYDGGSVAFIVGGTGKSGVITMRDVDVQGNSNSTPGDTHYTVGGSPKGTGVAPETQTSEPTPPAATSAK